MRYSFRGDVARGPDAILDDELLSKPLREPLGNETARYILGTAGGDTDDKPHRLHGIIERRSRVVSIAVRREQHRRIAAIDDAEVTSKSPM